LQSTSYLKKLPTDFFILFMTHIKFMQ